MALSFSITCRSVPKRGIVYQQPIATAHSNIRHKRASKYPADSSVITCFKIEDATLIRGGAELHQGLAADRTTVDPFFRNSSLAEQSNN
jgi:hypothetical protein